MSDKPQIGKRKHLSLAQEAQDSVRHGLVEAGKLEQAILSLPDTAPTSPTEWEATAYSLLRRLTAVRQQIRAAELIIEEQLDLIRNAPEPSE